MPKAPKASLITKIHKRLETLSEHYSLINNEHDIDLLYSLLERHQKIITLAQNDKTRLKDIIHNKCTLLPLLNYMNYHDLFLIEDCLIQIHRGIADSKEGKREGILYLIGCFIFLIYSFQFFSPTIDAIFGHNNSGTGPVLLIIPFLFAPAFFIGLFQEWIWKRKFTAFWRGILGRSFGLDYLPILVILLIVI